MKFLEISLIFCNTQSLKIKYQEFINSLKKLDFCFSSDIMILAIEKKCNESDPFRIGSYA